MIHWSIMKSQTTNHAKRGLSARSEHPPNLRGVNVWGMDFTWTPAYFGLRLSKNGQGLNDWYAILLEWGPHGAPKSAQIIIFSRMRSKGSRFTLGVWGLRVCSLDVAQPFETVRNRHFTLHTLHSTLYTPHSPLHTLHSTLYTPYSTFHTLHSTLHTLHSTLHTQHSALDTPHSALHTPHFTLYTPHSTVHTLHSTLHTLHSTLPTLYTLDSTLHALHFTPYTLHSTLYTPHFTLYTLHSTLYTPHLTLDTLHSTLHTLHSTLFRIPQSTVHWYGNRWKMHKTQDSSYNLFHKSVLRDCIRVWGHPIFRHAHKPPGLFKGRACDAFVYYFQAKLYLVYVEASHFSR